MVLRGAMDINTAREFTRALERVAAESPREIILNLAAVDFIDSLGLHTLLRGRAYCEKHGCAFLLDSAVPPRIRRLIGVAGVGEYLAVKSTGPDAA